MKHIYIIISVVLFSLYACTAEQDAVIDNPGPVARDLNLVICSPVETRVDNKNPGKSNWDNGDVVRTFLRFFDSTGKELTAFSKTITQKRQEVGIGVSDFVVQGDYEKAVPLNAVKVVASSFYSNDTTFTFSAANNTVTFTEKYAGYFDILTSVDSMSLSEKNDTIRIAAWNHPLSRIKVVSAEDDNITIKSIHVPQSYSLETATMSYREYVTLSTMASSKNGGGFSTGKATGTYYCCAFFYGQWLKDEYILTYKNQVTSDDVPAFVGKPVADSSPGTSYIINLMDAADIKAEGE